MAENIEQTPAAPTNQGGGTPPAAETISVPKSEWEEMKKMVTGLADKTSKQFGYLTRKIGLNKGRGNPSGEPDNLEEERELTQAVKGISLAIASNPDYQKLIVSDKTLQQVLENNPLSILKGNFTSADEIIDAFKDYMDERAIDLPSPSSAPTSPAPVNPPVTPAAPPTAPTSVQPAASNPSGEEVPGETEEQKAERERISKLLPEQQIAAKIASRVKVQ